jgi:hypothetical protein
MLGRTETQVSISLVQVQGMEEYTNFKDNGELLRVLKGGGAGGVINKAMPKLQ